MQIEINVRGNGACPLCASHKNCRVQDSLSTAIEVFYEDEDPLEMVVYSCPKFREKKENE